MDSEDDSSTASTHGSGFENPVTTDDETDDNLQSESIF